MEHFFTQKELPLSERPYEKCERFGPEVLSDAELLAVIIRSGTKKERAVDLAIRVLDRPGSKKGLAALNYYSQKELQKIKGIGRVKAIQLCCAAELAKRMQAASFEENTAFTTPQMIADAYMGRLRHCRTEEIILLMLDTKGRKIADSVVSRGTVNSAILEPREVLTTALRYEAVCLVILHNHPSGSPTPSEADILATKRLAAACEIVGFLLRDHIIIGDNRYLSMKERGLLN
ncbi:MAG: DNA repair protein RadC [Lachnospiraceae bacterium]|nr:DNA repair protein RadC [Lachnospiraceae bacterium]